MLFDIKSYDETKQWMELQLQNFKQRTYKDTSQEYDTLFALLKGHPSYPDWIHTIPYAFQLSKENVIKLKVSFIDFSKNKMTRYRIVSWVACCKGKRKVPTPNAQLTGAMRYAIKRQINNYKNSHPNKICELCESTIKIEVDHYPTKFVTIKTNFIESMLNKNSPPPETFNWHPKRGQPLFTYKDKKWKLAWQIYHRSHATYRYLCSTCNKVFK